MRVRFGVRRSIDGWEVSPSIETGPDARAVLRTTPRLLGRAGSGTAAYPLPPKEEADALAADAPHRDLCTAAEPAPLVEVHRAIVDRAPRSGDMVRFGRYLFETLIGDPLWNTLVTRAAGKRIEIGIVCDADDQAINKLPWEMMRTDVRYLAQTPGVSIVRRIRDPGARAPVPGVDAAVNASRPNGATPSAAEFPRGPLHSPPRVLFVVGTGLDDPEIRPGAEYVRLLMSLRARGTEHRLQTRLVQLATPAKMQAAILDFRPDVVHMICHGWHDAVGQGYIELVDEQDAAARTNVYPGALLALLRPASEQSLPHVVVLSACYTASVAPGVGQVAAPIAAELVHGGVPVVVGMSGRVSDQACRLFTRRFYEALLDREDVASAAAEGRLAALAEGGVDPDAGVDWTLPTLYVTGDPSWRGLEIPEPVLPDEWFGGATEYGTGPHPAFCDRLHLFERFDVLLAGRDEQRVLTGRPAGIQVVTIAVDTPDDRQESERQLGRTWLLREFAAKAAREGHLPCLVVPSDLVAESPKTLRSLVECLGRAMRDTQRIFGLTAPAAPNLQPLLALNDGDVLPADTSAELRDVSPTYDAASIELHAVALRIDLLRLLEQVRRRRPPPHGSGARLVLLIDDLHRMGADAVRALLYGLLGTAGLRLARDDVRIVLSYSTTPITGQEATKKEIDDWLGDVTWVDARKLEPFRPPVEEGIAYQHYLMHWYDEKSLEARPLTVNERSTLCEVFLRQLSEDVKGIPYRLKPDEEGSKLVRRWLEISQADPDRAVLRPADDEDRLRLVRAQAGGG